MVLVLKHNFKNLFSETLYFAVETSTRGLVLLSTPVVVENPNRRLGPHAYGQCFCVGGGEVFRNLSALALCCPLIKKTRNR